MSDLHVPRDGPRCNQCSDQIRWVRLGNGRRVPIDPEPSPAGHVILLDDERALMMSDEWRLEVLSDENHPARPRVFLDHRETCGRIGLSPAMDPRSKRWARREQQRERKLEAEARIEARRTRRKISPSVRAVVMARDGHACVLCGATEDLTLDHIFPHVEGGSDHAVNLRVLCRSCNSSKGASIPDSIRLMGRD